MGRGGDLYLDDGMLFVIANKLDGDLLAYWASISAMAGYSAGEERPLSKHRPYS